LGHLTSDKRAVMQKKYAQQRVSLSGLGMQQSIGIEAIETWNSFQTLTAYADFSNAIAPRSFLVLLLLSCP
jgi:hypothetical protein